MVNNTIILWLNLFSLFLPRKNFDNNQINQNSAFGEILGQLCEYTLSNQMGIPKSSIIPVHGRFSVLNNEYFYNGVLDYNESRIQATYGVLAGFGIYLLKNYFARRRIPHLWCRYSRRRLCNAEYCIGTNPSRKRYILISDRWQLSYHCLLTGIFSCKAVHYIHHAGIYGTVWHFLEDTFVFCDCLAACIICESKSYEHFSYNWIKIVVKTGNKKLFFLFVWKFVLVFYNFKICAIDGRVDYWLNGRSIFYFPKIDIIFKDGNISVIIQIVLKSLFWRSTARKQKNRKNRNYKKFFHAEIIKKSSLNVELLKEQNFYSHSLFCS